MVFIKIRSNKATTKDQLNIDILEKYENIINELENILK